MKTLTIIIIGELLVTFLAVLSDAVLIALIGGVVSVISTISLFIMFIIKNKVEKIGTDVNGHMTNLLNLTEAKGKLEGKAEEKKEAGK